MHWADVLAEELLERGSEHTLATGITPSGPIHVGNLREVLTTEAVYRALEDRGGQAELVYVADTYDPLREVYPFLEHHPEVDYEEHVGKPISAVPAPDGEHDSFAHQFLSPFLASLEELGIHPRVQLAHEMYESGDYRESIEKALEHRDTIRGILEEVAGRDLEEDWLPFNPLCPACGRLNDVRILGFELPEIEIQCLCGFEGTIDALDPGSGKLPWRVDWPARWSMLEVTFEAFGKDHAASGGSWDTGAPIAEQVYGIEPPHHTVYEWIHVEGEGAMSSSAGTGIAAEDVLAVTPPEVLRFFFMRYQPSKHVTFDPGEGLLELVDDYDRALQELAEGEQSDELRHPRRVIELSQPSGTMPEHPGQTVSMRHLARLVDIYEDTDEVLASVRRSGHVEDLSETEQTLLRGRIEHTRAWLSTFAPDDARVRLPKQAPPVELVYALDEFRKPRISLLESEPSQLRTRTHELTAWLDGAPNVQGGSTPPGEFVVVAVWRALAEQDAVDADPGDLPQPRDLSEHLQGLFAGDEPASLDREGEDTVLAPLILHLARSRDRPASQAEPEQLVDRIERWIETTGAGRPGCLPSREGLEELTRALHEGLHEALVLQDRSPKALAGLSAKLSTHLGEAQMPHLEDESFQLPELSLRDVLLACTLLERARLGLAAYREELTDADWTAEDLQACAYETAERTGIPTGDVFGLVYLAVLDEPRGPRLGPFLAGLERDWVLDRLADVTREG